MLPGLHTGHQFDGDQLEPEQFGKDAGAEEFFEDVGGEFGCAMPVSVFVQESVGDQGVEVGVEVEVFAKGVEGEEQGGLTGGSDLRKNGVNAPKH